LLPYNHHSKLERRVRTLLQQKHNDKGMTYVPEHNKTVAKQLEEKNKQPLFLAKIEVFGSSRQSIKQITSRFNSLSTNMNKFYSYGIVKYNKNKIENKIHSEFWFSGFLPKPHFYLNSAELACLWQPVYIIQELKSTSNKVNIYKL
jgi:hypothetical protein